MIHNTTPTLKTPRYGTMYILTLAQTRTNHLKTALYQNSFQLPHINRFSLDFYSLKNTCPPMEEYHTLR